MSGQVDNLTTSLDGTKRVAKLQPISHFFLEDNNFTQQSSEAFGAVDADHFQTTATVTFSGLKKVYALCSGMVFLQPQTGSTNKINLILKPYRQPINGINIKYVIYRGLQKSDIITTDGKVAGSASSGIAFTQLIWQQFEQFYDVGNGGTPPDLLAKFIGFPHTANLLGLQTSNSLLETYFFKITPITDPTSGAEDPLTAYELPVVPRGIELGQADGSLGIDIILNQGEYQVATPPFPFDLAFAREQVGVINISNEPDAFKQKQIKEVATQFLDIAAFYGIHANGAGKLYIGTQTTPLKAKADIYAQLQNFHTKNHFYLYIQGNRQRSYNFYGNYEHSENNTNDLNIGITADTLSETNFGTDGWPIQVIHQSQDPNNEDNTIVFQLTTDNHKGAALYTAIGVLASEHEENFVRQAHLLQDNTDDTLDVNYTQPITLRTPAISGDTIATFAQLIYEGKVLTATEYIAPPPAGQTAPIPQEYGLKDIDDIFGLVEVNSVTATENAEQLPIIISEQLQVINFPNKEGGNDIGVIKYQKRQDKVEKDDGTFLNRVTFETLLHNIKRSTAPYVQNSASSSDSVSAGTKSYTSLENRFYQPKLPYYFQIQPFSHGYLTVNGLVLKSKDNTLVSKKMLGLTQEENDRLKSSIQTNNLLNAKVYFKKANFNVSNTYISPEEVSYHVYELLIVGENTQGTLEVHLPAMATGATVYEPIMVYSIEGNAIYSQNYSEYQRNIISGLTYIKLTV